RATTDHLRKCPIADPLAVRRRAALVPQDSLDDPVQVLLELPAKAALPDPGLTHDGHEPRLPLACGGMELVLQEAQLFVASNERRLELECAPLTSSASDNGHGAPSADRGFLALEHVLPSILERDRPGRSAV